MAKKKADTGVKLTRFSAEYVQRRTDKLKEDAEREGRNARMDRYEKVFDMDMWLDAPSDGESRVTSPLGFSTVQQMVALLFTRPYTINVPPAGKGVKANNAAQKKEKYLYGLTDQAGVRQRVRDAAWHAACLGENCIRLYYKGQRYADEFPLCFDAIDPRTIFGTRDAGGTRYIEVAHSWDRPRREIEQEWGVETRRPDTPFDDAAAEQAWLDEAICYTEYWYEAAKEEEQWQKQPADEDEDRQRGVMELVKPPGGISTAEDAESAEISKLAAEIKPRKRKKIKVLVRKVVHTVVCQGEGEPQQVKAPVVMPGYSRIPFYSWAGIRTPRPGSKGSLSVLYALTNGVGKNGGLGVLQTLNELMSMDLTITHKAANPAAMTDDPDLAVDLTPGAINQVAPGKRGIWYVENPGTAPDVNKLTQMMRDEASRVTIPEVLSGQFVQASGQALGIMSSVFEQSLGFSQEDAANTLSRMYSQVMELTEYYADPEIGWEVNGEYKRKNFTEWIKPEDIDGDYRVRVKLSANLPRDTIAMLQSYMQLWKAKAISWETFLDLFQKLTDAGADTPLEEMANVLANMGLLDGKLAQMLAEAMGKEYVDLLGVNLPPPEPPPQPPASGGLGGGEGAGGGMPGVPNPQMVAAMGNLQGAQNMQGMQPPMM